MTESRRALKTFSENAYRDYAMYVILDRALPALQDGLKPVQRRLIFAMSELGLSAKAKPKKSARTVGDVIGKYHPHGDSACYEAMVLLAQDFSCRHPLIEGQGNWGSADEPKSFAAMRYTEARLSPYAATLLDDLAPETVPWRENFDATLKEPQYLPAAVPNLLINGASGIAVGMATDIPPHNLGEVLDAARALLRNPELDDAALGEILPAPDFPTGGEIVTAVADLRALYRQGQGTLKLRARYHCEGENIVIDELPYQVSGNKIQEQIARQMREKKCPWLADLRDESDHENPTRLVLIPNGNIETERLMSHLFATTELEKTQRVQLNLIGLDGHPRIHSLREILGDWLRFRRVVLRARETAALAQAQKERHRQEALRRACAQREWLLTILRDEDAPEAALKQGLGLDDEQCEMLLNSKLRQLSKLSALKIAQHCDALDAAIAQSQHLLAHPEALQAQLEQELMALKQRFADPRRSRLVARESAQALAEREMLPSEPLTFVASKMGWVRSAKGNNVDGAALSYKTGDAFALQVAAHSDDTLVLFSTAGQCYNLELHGLPSARGYGEPLSSLLEFQGTLAGAQVLAADARYLVLAENGSGFVAAGETLTVKTRSGKTVFCDPEHALCALENLPAGAQLFLISREGRALILPAEALPERKRGKGVRLIHSAQGLQLWGVFPEACDLALYTAGQKWLLRAEDWVHYQGKRGSTGVLLPRGYRQLERWARV